MDIKDFYRSNPNQNTPNTNENANKSTQDFSEYQDTINKYKDLSQSDLYSELFNQANQLKNEGKLNNDMLNTIASTIAPMLNEEQQQTLNSIIDKLK